jgi:drug/metabolite transporter (DMT)-like permease
MAATLVFCLGDTMMKLASTSLPTSELIFLRGCVGVTLVFIAAVWTGALLRLRQAFCIPMGHRVVGDISGAMFFQAALARMPLPDLMAILQVTPLSLTAASALFLGERVGWRRWTAVGCGLLGALLIIKPGTNAFNWWAIAAIVSVLGGTLRDVSTRRIDPMVPPFAIMLLSTIAVTLAGLVAGIFDTWEWPSGKLMLFMAGAATCSMVGQLCTIIAVRAGEISAVAPFRYTGIIWGIAVGFMIWGHLPDNVSMIGIAIVIVAGLYTLYREQKLRRLAAAARRAQAKASG